MFVESAKILGHKEDEEKFTEVLRKAKESFEVKLWNGMFLSLPFICIYSCKV